MRKFTKFFCSAVLLLAMVAASACGEKEPKPYEIVDGVIVYNTPERAEGQQDMLLFAAEKMDTVRIGFIGLGKRGHGGVKRMSRIEGTKIVALCDLKMENIEKCQGHLDAAGRPRADYYTGSTEEWRKLCERDDLDLVYISVDWKNHVPMAEYALECGKHVAIEVPSAMNMKDIWRLIDLSEQKRLHCTILENCIYDFYELTTLNMAQEGLFGEILHAEGAYIHCLDASFCRPDRTWRIEYNNEYAGDVYPTHGLGPICLALDIHRGDRLKTLVAMDTKAVLGPKYYEIAKGEPAPDFQNGDQTTTLIRTENGKVIQLHHNVMTPRPYSRDYMLVGTKGYASKYPVKSFLFQEPVLEEVHHENLTKHKCVSEEERDALLERYKHPILKEVGEMAKKVGGHGGMDYIMDYRLIYCLRNGLPLDMDVYDLAEWCCPAELSAVSIKHGSKPVAIPDFTRGAWNKVKGYKFAYAE